MRAAKRDALRANEAAELAPMKAPENFPTQAIDDETSGQHRQLGILQNGEIGAQPRQAEKHRHEEGRDQAAQLLVDMLR